AADAVCLGGDHSIDWDPFRVRVEPALAKSKPGSTVKAVVVVRGGQRVGAGAGTLQGRGLGPGQSGAFLPKTGAGGPQGFEVKPPPGVAPGRHVFAVDSGMLAADAFLAVDVTP